MKNSTGMWLLAKIKPNIPSLLFLTFFSIASSLCGVFFALGIRGVIDSAVKGDITAFFRACIIQGSIILIMVLCLIMTRHLRERTHAALDRVWKKVLLHNLMHSEYRSVSAFHSSELINRLNNDVRILDDGIVNLIPNLSGMLAKLVAAFGVLTALTPWFALGMLGAGLVVICITGLLRKQMKKLHKKVSEADGRVSAIMQETMEKLLVVQAMDITTEIERRVKSKLDERFEIHNKRKNVSLFANTCVNIMFYGAGFVALIWCSFGLLNGLMSFGTLTAVIQLVNQLQSPLVGLSGIIPQYFAALAAAERLQELDLLPKTVVPCQESATDIYNRTDAIVAKNLTFSYGRDCVLDNAQFCLPKGSFCVITGSSGTGKSTALKLFLGIFPPEQGELYLQCGEEKLPINAGTRRLFNYVPQGNLIFSGTIRENLLVVKPEANEDELNRAVYISAMDLFLPQLPDGLDTYLGESGAGLSEGQAQRLAIARAILGDAPILLLDECTSALDMQTEAIVLERLRQLKDKTYIAVTHRPVAESVCDMVLHIEDYKIHTQIK